ncbi:signal peptidase I [Candidatus Poriferisodalis sp.]|uniref:signal peptidase I n=1 Tax=Candidatus Poriferisodalis sp. TaxID=3101277 RepID=UPI003B02DDC1
MSLLDEPTDPEPDESVPESVSLLDESMGSDTDAAPLRRERLPRIRRAMSRRTRNLLSWSWVMMAAVVLALLMRTFLVAAFFIPSESMEPELQIGDRLLVSKLSYRIGEPSPGDIVVFSTPDQLRDPQTAELVKRVVAIGGQTVGAVDGRLTIDGTSVNEEYLPSDVYTRDFGPVRVPADHIFVMGDNRFSSQDSRYFGPIHRNEIVGRAFARFWPPNRLGGL